MATVENFGKLGEKPTHPELLDWLAVELVEGGWTLKRMHRMIMTSQAFRQSSRKTTESAEADPDNSLVSRAALRRMDADQLYDSMLQVSGQLDPERFGPPVELDKQESRDRSQADGRGLPPNDLHASAAVGARHASRGVRLSTNGAELHDAQRFECPHPGAAIDEQ